MPYIVTITRCSTERRAVRTPEEAAELVGRVIGHTAFVPDAGGTFDLPDGIVTVRRQTWTRLEALAGMREGHDRNDTDAILDAYNAAQEA